MEEFDRCPFDELDKSGGRQVRLFLISVLFARSGHLLPRGACRAKTGLHKSFNFASRDSHQPTDAS